MTTYNYNFQSFLEKITKLPLDSWDHSGQAIGNDWKVSFTLDWISTKGNFPPVQCVIRVIYKNTMVMTWGTDDEESLQTAKEFYYLLKNKLVQKKFDKEDSTKAIGEALFNA